MPSPRLFLLLNSVEPSPDPYNKLCRLLRYFQPSETPAFSYLIMLFKSLATTFLLLPARLVVGHGAPGTAAEVAFREAHHEKAKRSIESCSQRLHKRDALEKRVLKTGAFIDSHRQSQAADQHHSNAALKRDFIVNGLNSTCILTPEAEEGRYCKDPSQLHHHWECRSLKL